MRYNSAYIGGGLRYIGIIPPQLQSNEWMKSNNMITDNTSTIFGDNIGSYPRNIELIFSDTISITKSSLGISNHNN